jgi:hypothetical protein
VYDDRQRKLQRACLKKNTVSIAPTETLSAFDDRVYTVYTDLPQVQETLKRPEFTFCRYFKVLQSFHQVKMNQFIVSKEDWCALTFVYLSLCSHC